jgi:hypothetical protein
MTEKDIVRLAEEAELWLHTDRKYEAVEKFAFLVAASEREACAKVCEELVLDHPGRADLTSHQCALAIRARGLDNMNKQAEQNGEQL